MSFVTQQLRLFVSRHVSIHPHHPCDVDGRLARLTCSNGPIPQTSIVVDVTPKVDATKGGEGYKSLTLLEVDAPKSPNTGTLGKISSRFFLARLNMPNSALR